MSVHSIHHGLPPDWFDGPFHNGGSKGGAKHNHHNDGDIHDGVPLKPITTKFSGSLFSRAVEFQAGSGDTVSNVADPHGNRSGVVKVDFNHGRYTTHSTSPRAELKLGGNLQEGGSYNYHFGFSREKNTSTTFFQVLDHNGSKPAPRMWLSVKDNRYVLHLREQPGAGAPVKTYNLGKTTPGKWDDINIDFKRGLGNGSVRISINGQNVFQKQGISTMYNTHSGEAYAKMGQYRNQGDHSPGAVYFSDVEGGPGSWQGPGSVPHPQSALAHLPSFLQSFLKWGSGSKSGDN